MTKANQLSEDFPIGKKNHIWNFSNFLQTMRLNGEQDISLVKEAQMDTYEIYV